MRYDVPLLEQTVSPICYVVCAAMIQKYWQQTAGNRFNTSDLTGGFDPVNSCIAAASVQGLYTERLQRAGFDLIPKPARLFDNLEVDEKLRLRGPLLLNFFVANFNFGLRRGGKQPANAGGIHAVVISGIVDNRAYFNNPWGDKDVEIPVGDLLTSIDQSYSHPYNALFYAVASPLPQNILD